MKLFFKRLLLVIIGLILSLVLLECGLRLAGWTISSYQQYKNNKALRNKSQYAIMCLGESTTVNQYPVQLQQILDDKYPNKFSVIDCGIGGTDLETILDLLDNNINKYHPNIAICMMGINNRLIQYINVDNVSYIKQSRFINFKIYKLFILIKLHLKNLLLANNIAFAQQIYDENNLYVENAIKLRKAGKIEEAKKILENIIKLNPNNEMAFVELCELYYGYLGEKERTLAFNMAEYALKKNFNIKKMYYYRLVFEFYCLNRDINSLQYYIEKAIDEDINMHIFSVTIYNSIKDFITPEQKEQILKRMIFNDDKDYGAIAMESINKKNYQKTQEYFDKAEEIRLNFPNEETYKLYKLIVKKLIDNNIKVICMQYPVRSVLPLQEQLKNESYYDKLTFISNEKLFKNALMETNYDEIFNDQFAGDFGHCTDLGNTMIAENIVNTLENILNLKKN